MLTRRDMPERHVVLFLCTANYYRSRFAEALFNHAAERAGLGWRAESAGLAFLCESRNPGVLSPYTESGLAARGISLAVPVRAPRDVTTEQLAAAQRIIAMKEHEHRPLLLRRFPEWTDRVEYWHVHDLDLASAEHALAAIESHVSSLIEELGRPALPAQTRD